MKILHLSDLHLGKRVNGFSMIKDQEYILNQIIDIVDTEQPRAVIIAGDVYDKPIPPAEAIMLLDDFLTQLAARNTAVFIISGNHDSAERIAFGGKLMSTSKIYMSPVYNGNVEPTVLQDEYGTISFYMLPFIKPVHVRTVFPDKEIVSYTDAVKTAIQNMNADFNERNILITHQLVTGAHRCDSEDISVGGADDVSAELFQDFDYVALGHLHGPQQPCANARYCGTPLKYSLSECGHKKSVTMIDIGKKGDINISTIPLSPLHDIRQIKGSYAELTLRENYINSDTDDYIGVTLTDENDIPDAIAKLRTIYPNIMQLNYDNARTRSNEQLAAIGDLKQKQPLELFSEFYAARNGSPMNDEQISYVDKLIQNIWEEQE